MPYFFGLPIKICDYVISVLILIKSYCCHSVWDYSLSIRLVSVHTLQQSMSVVFVGEDTDYNLETMYSPLIIY